MKNSLGNKIAIIVTGAMATWTFIAIILLLCVGEIAGNHYGIFHFDPTMLVLNTILSLWAAVQGSIIMINQNQADDKRDAMLKSILQIQNDMNNHVVGEESTIAEMNRKIDLILDRLDNKQ